MQTKYTASAAKSLAMMATFSLIASLTGCATTATVSRLRPAVVDVANVRRVVIYPFRGSKAHVSLASEAVARTLNEAGRYQLVTIEQLQQSAAHPLVAPTGEVMKDAVFHAAASAGIDAVLIGDIQVREEGGYDMGNATLIIGDPTLKARCRLKLGDLRSGMPVLDEQSVESYKGELSNDSSNSTSRTKLSEKLAQSAATAAARKISPHYEQSEVELYQALVGQGSSAIRRGNTLAQDGRWDEAVQEWEAVLAEDPENHAAIYSLGLAFEARGDLTDAATCFRLAVEKDDRKLYRTAQERIEIATREQRLAWNQLRPSPVPPTGIAQRPQFQQVAYPQSQQAASLLPPPSNPTAPIPNAAQYESRVRPVPHPGQSYMR